MGPVAAVVTFLDKYLPLIASIVGTVILAFSTLLIPATSDILKINRWQTLIEWLGIALFLWGSYAQNKDRLHAEQLESENQQLIELVGKLGGDIDEKFGGVLIQIFEKLEFNDDHRISLYRHEGQNFIMLSRFSTDPMKRKKGRGYYPDSQGCIGKAYTHKEAFTLNLPDPSEANYSQRMKKDWGIDQKIVDGFTMMPRSIAAFAFSNQVNYERELVIVYECTDAEAFAIDTLRTTCTFYHDTLLRLLAELKPLLPSLDYAKQKGF